MLMAQENETTQTETTETYQEEEETTDPTVLEDESQIESTSFHAALKQKFIEGGAAFMSFVILCLILYKLDGFFTICVSCVWVHSMAAA